MMKMFKIFNCTLAPATFSYTFKVNENELTPFEIFLPFFMVAPKEHVLTSQILMLNGTIKFSYTAKNLGYATVLANNENKTA